MRRFHAKPSTLLERTLQALQLYRIAKSPLVLSPFVRRASTLESEHFFRILRAERSLLTSRVGVMINWAHHSIELALLDNYCWSRSLLLPSLLFVFYRKDRYFWRFRTFARISTLNRAGESDIGKNHVWTWKDSFCMFITNQDQPWNGETLNLLEHWFPLRCSSEDLRFKSPLAELCKTKPWYTQKVGSFHRRSSKTSRLSLC